MNIKYLLNKKVDRLNEIFEHNHLPYAAETVPASRCNGDNIAEIFDIDNNTNTGIYMAMSFDSKCSIYTPGWHDIVDVNDLKIVRDICDCLLELNNMVLVKSEKQNLQSQIKVSNSGTNYSDVIKAIMNNSELMPSTIHQLMDMIPIYLDSITYESIIAVVSNKSRMLDTVIISNVKSICAQACKAGDRRN